MISDSLIREARRRAGLSQRELAARLGTHPTVISRWERAAVTPSLETLREVVRACGLELGFELAERDPHGQDGVQIARSLAKTPAGRLRENVEAVNALRRMSAGAAPPVDG